MGEFLFTALAVVTLPVWFLLLALWVVIDLPYHYTRWMSQKRIPEGQVKSVPGS